MTIHRENVAYVSEALRKALHKGHGHTRALRRILSSVMGTPTALWVSFAEQHQGFTPEQLRAIRRYAKTVMAEYGTPPEGLFAEAKCMTTIWPGDIEYLFVLPVELEALSSAALRDVGHFLLQLTQALLPFAGSLNATALRDCQEYLYRGLPCSIAPDEKLWTIAGSDVRGGSGILEWCYDQEDAEAVLGQMKRFPERFKNLGAAPYLS